MLIDLFTGFIDTPPLWEGSQFGVTQFDFPTMDLNGFSPLKIPENLRLGHKMEHVFSQLIQWEASHEILLQNVSVKSGKSTLGEIDFVLRNKKSNSFLHVELTYKFYIIDPSISEPMHRLMGPNRRDMFFTKLEKIKNEQFGLLHKDQAHQKLLDKNIDTAQLENLVCYKAQLFQPYTGEQVHIRPLNKACVVGYWLRFEDFERPEFSSYEYYIPFKHEWVTTPHENVQWSSHFETLMEINLRMIKQNAPMVWMRKSQNEFEKFFVVWW